ncbi:MAG: hypothetical protein FWE48_07915 [Coriobacteriia bacterium]|nr:hypothetical protein [Coriobacteriia bacterium]
MAQNKSSNRNALLAVLVIALLIVSALLIYSLVQQKALADTNQELRDTVALLQDDDMQEFIEYAKKVMAGEILIDDIEKDRLWCYSYTEEYYPEVTRIESDLTVLSVQVEGDTGVMKVTYKITYFDSRGKIVSAMGASYPVTWTLEKRPEGWFVIGNNDGP